MKLKVGQKFNIVPSDGFLGICRGEVEILRIDKFENVRREYVDPEELVNCDPSLKKAKWIVYKYTKPTCEDMYDPYCLDEDTFKYHTQGKELMKRG